MSTDNLLKLRLAARTLVEWGVPPTSSEYQQVLTDLLVAHPFAKDWGLHINSKILTVDMQGIILWYLTDTLKELHVSHSLEITSEHSRFLSHLFTDTLIDYGVLAEPNSKKRTDEPSKARIVDSIIAAILSKRSYEQSLGFNTILALFVPLDLLSQQKTVHQLVAEIKTQSRVIQRLSKLIQNRYTTIVILLLVFTVTSMVSYILTPILLTSLKGVEIKLLFWNITGYTLLLTLSTVLTIISSFLSLIVTNNEKAVKKRLRKIDNNDRFTEIRILQRQKREKPIVEYSGTNDIQKLIKRQNTISRFLRFIRFNCGKYPKVFESLLLAEGNPEWSEIVLASTKVATRDVIQDGLSLIKDSKLSKELRSKIFFWLCKVEIIENQNEQSVVAPFLT